MSTTTPNLGLHKYDPASDGNLYFDIDTGINGPLDIIDQRLGGEVVEKAPTSFEIQRGVGIYNAGRKSRVKNLSMTGRTLVNLVGRRGNLGESGTSVGISLNVSASVDTSTYTYGTSALKVLASAGTGYHYYEIQGIMVSPLKYHLMVVEVKPNVGKANLLLYSNGEQWNRTGNIVSDTSKFSISYVTVAGTSSTTELRAQMKLLNASGSDQFTTGSTVENTTFDGLRVYEITATEKAYIDGLSVADAQAYIAAKYPYVDDVKSVNAVYLRNPGKNLLPPFTEWVKSASFQQSITGPYNCSITTDTSLQWISAASIPVMPNTSYTLSASHNGYLGVYGTDQGISIVKSAFGQSVTFNTGNNTRVDISFSNVAGTAGTFTISGPMLNISTTALPFEPQKPSYMYLPDCNLRSSVDGSIADKLYTDGEGKPRAIRRYKEVTLDTVPSSSWTINGYTGFKRVYFTAATLLGSYVSGSATVVKYDGKIITTGSTSTGADIQALSVDGNFYLTISSADSGWGDSYTPTVAEIQAYFNGWRMCNYDVSYTTPYNGTGTKGWTNITTAGGNGTTVLPTSIAPTYVPYRLIYQLAQSVDEAINYEGSLLLHDGANQIEVGTGVVVREMNKPGLYNDQYFLNDTSLGSALKNRVASIWRIYRNQLTDSAWTKYSGGNQYGNMKANITTALFDRTASYSVTYLALDTYLLGFAPDTITAEYAPNIKESVDVLVRDMVEAKTALSVLQNTKAQTQQPQWIQPTLLNGWVDVGDVPTAYLKDSEGFVHVRVNLKGGPTTTGTPIFFLPKGYRPTSKYNFSGISGPPTMSMVRVQVAADGSIFVIEGTIGSGLLTFNMIFLAEQ